MIRIEFTQFVGTGDNLLSEPSGIAQLPQQHGSFIVVNDTNPQKALFIANLAFADPVALDQAKIGVLGASVFAAVLGLGFLHRALPRKQVARAATSPAGD